MASKTTSTLFHNKHKVSVSKSLDQQSASVGQLIQSVLQQQQSHQTQNCIVGFSGGSMPAFIAPLLAQLPDQALNRLQLFPVDERLVPQQSEESNAGTLLRLLSAQKFQGHVLSVPDDLVEENGQKAAEQFERQLRSLDPHIDRHGYPVFDLLLLGLGPDGHTCSLFPGHPLALQDAKVWISHLDDSPKPPPRRITVTMPVLSAARQVAFIANGAGKAGVIKKIIADDDQQFPPSRIQRGDQQSPIEWFIDEEAASQIV